MPSCSPVGRAHTAVDVEYQHLAGAARAVDPEPRQVGEGREVPLRRHRLGLEAAHLAGGRSLVRHRSAAHGPAHRGITPEPVGIVHVLVASEATEHGLAELSDQAVATVHPGARVAQRLGGKRGQAERVVEFPEREQAGIGGDACAVELQLQAAVEIEPEADPPRFHPSPRPSAAPLDGYETLAVHSRFTRQRHRATRSSGKCGLKPMLNSNITLRA